jgi:hypothetical protein
LKRDTVRLTPVIAPNASKQTKVRASDVCRTPPVMKIDWRHMARRLGHPDGRPEKFRPLPVRLLGRDRLPIVL